MIIPSMIICDKQTKLELELVNLNIIDKEHCLEE